jgi:hypothetical protein
VYVISVRPRSSGSSSVIRTATSRLRPSSRRSAERSWRSMDCHRTPWTPLSWWRAPDVSPAVMPRSGWLNTSPGVGHCGGSCRSFPSPSVIGSTPSLPRTAIDGSGGGRPVWCPHETSWTDSSNNTPVSHAMRERSSAMIIRPVQPTDHAEWLRMRLTFPQNATCKKRASRPRGMAATLLQNTTCKKGLLSRSTKSHMLKGSASLHGWLLIQLHHFRVTQQLGRPGFDTCSRHTARHESATWSDRHNWGSAPAGALARHC